MALSLVLSVETSASGDAVYLYDITGLYDASSNPNGWGAPNDVPGDVISAILTITDYDGNNVGTIDVTDSYTDLGSSPTAKMLLATNSGPFTDGWYKFSLAFSSATPTAINPFEVEALILIETKNARDQLWIRAFQNGKCNCNDKDVREAMRAEVIYRSMKANENDIEAANVNKIMELAEDVQDIYKYRCLNP